MRESYRYVVGCRHACVSYAEIVCTYNTFFSLYIFVSTHIHQVPLNTTRRFFLPYFYSSFPDGAIKIL